MIDYTKLLPEHETQYVGENDLFIEIYKQKDNSRKKDIPLLLVHGAYTGGWMWSKYIPHLVAQGWECYVMNLRGHYKSRSVDLTTTSFDDYLADIQEVISTYNISPIVFGFSMGGILCQKIAENDGIKGLVLIDSAISKEVNFMVPYESPACNNLGIIEPAPIRVETSTIDESENDILFQKKYNSIESAKVFQAIGCWMQGVEGISINSECIKCPTLVIKSLSREEKDKRGKAEATHLNADYAGFWNMTHTGLLVGQRYLEVLDKIIPWLNTCK